MRKLEAWKLWEAYAHSHTGDSERTLALSSHGSAFSFAWDAAVAEEREACAKVCDKYIDSCDDHEAGTASNIQDAIRARGESK